MKEKIEQYKEILNKLQVLQPPEEKNIFSLGGKGHYENPISDILAFYLDKNEEHGLQDLCIRSYIECVSKSQNTIKSLPLDQFISRPCREVVTENNKRIDILIEGNTWVLIIENKIWHNKNNPFVEYEEYVRTKYNNKTIYLTVLSPLNKDTPAGWVGVSYDEFINTITNNIGRFILGSSLNKWIILLREFILNIKSELRLLTMDNQVSDFIEDNIKKIRELRDIEKNHCEFIFSNANIDDNLIKSKDIISIEIMFKTKNDGVLIGYENIPSSRSSTPSSYVPIMFVGTDGRLRSQLWNGRVNPITSKETVNDGNWHHAILVVNKDIQVLYLDGDKIGQLDGKINNLDMSKNQWGTGFCSGWGFTNGYWFRFKGEIAWVRIWDRPLEEEKIKHISQHESLSIKEDVLYLYDSKIKPLLRC